MEVTSSIREEDGKTQVTVTLEPKETKKYIDEFFKKLAKTRIPGFRPGKAPRKVVEQNFGGHDEVYGQIAEEAINDVVKGALDGQDIIFITDAEFEDPEELEDDKPFTFTCYGEVKPELELSSYDPVSITLPPKEATPAEIDKQIDSLREYYYSFETIKDRPARKDDYVKMVLTLENNGQKIEGYDEATRLIELGQGLMPASFDEQIVGANPGEVLEFDFEHGDDEAYAFMGTGAVHATVEIEEIRVKVIPELDQDFADKVGADSIDKLRDEIADTINKQRAEGLSDLKERRCVQALTERVHDEIGESYINYTREDILRDFFASLQKQGVNFDQWLSRQGISVGDFRADLEKEAKEVAEQSLALDALFRAQGWELTDEDIDKEFQVVDDPEKAKKAWAESGRMAILREACRRSKATQWLVETASVTEEVPGEKDEQDE